MQRPSVDQLQKFIEEGESYTSIGKKYGISGNAVKKWFKKYGIHEARTRESVIVLCALCKASIKKEYNQTISKKGTPKKNLFCSDNCARTFTANSGKLANVTIEEVENMLTTMSLRAVARHFGVHHTSLKKKFKI